MIEEVVLGSDIHKCQRLSPETNYLMERLVKVKYNKMRQMYLSKLLPQIDYRVPFT